MDSQLTLGEDTETATTEDPKCHFFRLPQELRDQVYDLVVKSPHKLQFDIYEFGPRSLPQQPGLTQTCREIRVDSLDRYYKCNVFNMAARGLGILPPFITNHIAQIHHFKIGHIHAFFSLNLSKGLRQYKLVLNDYRPMIVFCQWRLMALNRGTKYLTTVIDDQPEQITMTSEILIGLIKATEVR